MMGVKREATESKSSNDEQSHKPKRANTASPQQKYTVDDALLIQKLKEENGLSWEYVPCKIII